MKQYLFAIFMEGVLAVALLVAHPDGMPAYALEIGPCTDDFKQYCGDVTPGGGRLVRCYEERKDKMSADCVGWAETAKANAKPLQASCSKELDARCNSEKGDPFETLDCLQSNYIDLSMGCREKLNTFKGRYPKPIQ
jgi:hypothetical protein